MIPIQHHPAPLEAFCPLCPPPDEVTAVLHTHGFRLTLSMEPSNGPRRAVPLLPAHYHFRDETGTEVIFLAGKDTPEDAMARFPIHASRWWVYPGANPAVYQHLLLIASAHWPLTWKSLHDQEQRSASSCS
ncbi:MAG TPA: hypothetical protein VKX46_14095 [Ktedonobacteraceae bacterium]|nr:hypothetical protein [Ktedonobacteraceae bacterium]